MLITLHESEIAELSTHYSKYSIEPAPVVQPNWVQRKFASTNRTARCIENSDGSVTIKQINESTIPSTQMPLWL